MTKLFGDYKHSIPIINSHLEGQYDYTLSSDKYSFRIMYTDFDYNYVTGEIPKNDKEFIGEIRKYIKKHNKEEFVLFSPSEEWDTYLSKIFSYIGGVIDLRYSFDLDQKEFERVYEKYQFKHDVKLIRYKDKMSKTPYFKALVEENGKEISFSRAFMEGANNAEIDVWTDKKNRYEGLAFETSLVLINRLLELGFKPNWSCWEAKKASHMLAYKLGFVNPKKIKTFIWVSDFGEF